MKKMKKTLRLIERMRFILLGALLLITPLMIDSHILLGSGPETKFRFFEFGVFLGCLFTLPFFICRRSPIRLNLLSIALLLFLIYVLVLAIFDVQRAYAFDYALRTVCWILFAFLASDVSREDSSFHRLVWIAVIVQIAVVLYAISHIYDLDPYFNRILVGHEWRYSNPLVNQERGVIWALGNPNYYACFGSLLLISIAAMLALARRWRERLFWTFYGAIVLYSLLYTQTRGIWVSLFSALFFLAILILFFSKTIRQDAFSFIKSRRRSLAAGALAIFLLLAGLYLYETRQGRGLLHSLSKRFQQLAAFQDISLRARPLLWSAAMQMWREAPISGAGHGRYTPRFLETVYGMAQQIEPERIQQLTRHMNSILANETHNDYLQYLSEIGGAGYALFLLVLAACIASALRSLIGGNLASSERILLLACLMIVLHTIFHCLYDFPLRLPGSAMLFGLAIGGILHFNSGGFALSLPAWFRWLAASVMLPLCLLGGVFVFQHYLSTHLQFKGESHFGDAIKKFGGDYERQLLNLQLSQAKLSQAYALFPGKGEILFDQGKVYYFLAGYMGADYQRRAIDCLEQAKDTYAPPEVYQMLANVYLNAMQYPNARRYLDILLLVDPERENIQFLAANICMAENKWDEAERRLQEELRHHPSNPNALFLLGVVYEKRDLYEMTAQMYEKSLELAPNAVETLERLADLYAEKLKQSERAFSLYGKAINSAIQGKNQILQDRLRRKIRDLQRSQNMDQ
ncbi:MAG: O-antigen ligase family protein [Candidatus Omnitrophota bacterium]